MKIGYPCAVVCYYISEDHLDTYIQNVCTVCTVPERVTLVMEVYSS